MNSEFQNKNKVADPEHQKIITIIEDLWENGIVQRGKGYCYSMSDIISKLLKLNGIDCYMEECSLMILRKSPPDLFLVGYPGPDVMNNVKEVHTHVVCITKTKNPILIDLSINGFIDEVPFICERIVDSNNVEISNFEFKNSVFKYSRKSEQQLPILHQQSIIERIDTDKRIFSSIKNVKLFLLGLATISSLNLLHNTFDFYQKYIVTNNGFGPSEKIFNK